MFSYDLPEYLLVELLHQHILFSVNTSRDCYENTDITNNISSCHSANHISLLNASI